MTEERKQELRQLLEEATKKENLEIRYGSEPVSLPVDLYGRYLEERWTFYGVDFLSFWWSRFTLDIKDEITKSNLLDFMREELALFISENRIPIASYVIERNSTDESRLGRVRYERTRLYRLIGRLLEIAIVRGVEEAISVLNRCSGSKGVHGFFQHVVLLGGIKIEKAIQVFEGVRLVPPPSLEISQEVMQYLLGFPRDVYIEASSLLGKTLLVIDCPGFSIFHKSSDPTFPPELPVDEPPFQIEKHNMKLPNMEAVHSFRNPFCQALSLVFNIPVQIVDDGLFFLMADKSFNPYEATVTMFRHANLVGSDAEVEKVEIEKAKCLYKRLVDLDSNDREKLQIPIDRWIKSKTDKMTIGEITNENPIDKIIDLGIALEALYVTSHRKIGKRLRDRASWYLGKDNEDQAKLNKEFKEIYEWRSKAVHTGELPNKTEKIPFTTDEIRNFIDRTQNLCRKSIKKILDDGKFPDWNSLILSGEEEQANS